MRNETKIEEIQKRLDNASKGPWCALLEGRDFLSGDSIIKTAEGNEICFLPDRNNLDDIDFVAHSRSDIEYLLTLIKELSG